MPGAGEVHRNPFGELGLPISDSDLRETAYELFVGACRSSGSKPLTYIPQSEKREEKGLVLQRSLTTEAAGKVKAVLGLKSKSKKKGSERENVEGSERKGKRSVGEVMRNQMRVSEQVDSRVRKVLLRIAAGQLGRRFEALVLPLELLQHFRPSDFTSQVECEAWQKRNLKILELGLLLHPHVPMSKSDPSAQRLKQMIRGFLDKPTWKTNESMEVLRTVVMSCAGRSFGGSPSSECHWADGYPLNLRLYQMLLEACFDINDETSIIEEVDEVLELIKKTWVVLALNQRLHNICFLWVLFHCYIESGETENDLLIAASNLITEVEREPESAMDLEYSKILIEILSVILGWAEKRLLTYHETFHSGNLEFMQSAASLGISAAKILAQYSSLENRKKRKEVDVARGRVETYIRSSVRSAFAQRMEKISLIKRSSNKQQSNIPVLSILAQEVTELAINEKETYSVVLKRWHPLAAGLAVATLHQCYGNELEQFVSSISELTPDAVQVLITADKLEKHLVNIAVEDSVDSDDGGKAIIKEMRPYEAEIMIATLVKSWIKTRLDVVKEWVDRNLQQETWNAQANKEHIAPSAIEVLRTVEETMEAFFLLPIPIQPDLVADLVTGFDRCLQHYIKKAKSGCGTRNSYLPSMPALTRCSTGSKFFKKKEKFQSRKPQVGSPTVGDTFGIPQLCVRINTMQRVRAGVDYLEKKIITCTKNSGLADLNYPNGSGMKMDLTSSACLEGLQQLCEATALKVIFHELSHVLWDSLYVGEVSSSRIDPVLQELEKYLEIIATTVHDRVRTRVITEVMKASFDGFLLVLLAGGPSRAFSLQGHAMILEDFKLLCDLFWSNGDGLPTDLIDKLSVTVKRVLPLLQLDTESLIQQFRQLTLENYGPSGKSGLPLPPTSVQWDPTEPNTLLRVLCHRNDKVASNFLKKTYGLPKKL
ncbi:unc-13-like protein [Drosera capensis]